MEHVLSGTNERAPVSYREALDYLYARTTRGLKFGLDRTIALLHELGDPQHAFPAIHIAGTNGKGSSVATAEALLRGRGLRVAKYTSPHLVDFRERIVVDGQAIPAEHVAQFVGEWTPTVERVGATFFEATTAMAFAYFAQCGVDVALVETGLGGRLDSTNVLMPVAAGVTTIDYDHTEFLGNTLEQIAAEKAGIFKPGRPAVIGEHDRGLAGVLAAHAARARSQPVRIVADETSVAKVQVGPRGTTFELTALGETRRLHTPLAGAHQAQNVAFTLVLLHAAGPRYAMTLDDGARWLLSVDLPGRFQREGRCIFDVAHNPEGAVVLAETLAMVKPPAPVVSLFSALGDKDWRRMLLHLAPLVDHFVLTTAPTAPASRLWNLAEVAEFAREHEFATEIESDFDTALARAMEQGQTVLVTGSFHTVGDAMARLQVSPSAR